MGTRRLTLRSRRASLIAALAVLALGAVGAGCGADADSTNGGDAGSTPTGESDAPSTSVPTVGRETTPSGSLGGAGPEGGSSGPGP